MKNNLINMIKNDLNIYECIILIDYKNIDFDLLFTKLNQRNIVLYIPSYLLPKSERVNIRIISENDKTQLIRLYHLYEFSDRFRILADIDNYGGLWNLYETNILSESQLYESLLYLQV